MTFKLGFNEPSNNNNGWTSGSAYVYSTGLGFPGGNPDINGNRAVYLASCSADYVSGGSGTYVQVIHEQSHGVSGGGAWFPSAGSFQFRVGHSSGTQYVGRNTGGAGGFRYSDGHTPASGGISGSLQYGTYPSACQGVSASRNGRTVTVTFSGPASNGGYSVTSYGVQYSDDNGATWKGQQNVTTGTAVFPNLPPGKPYIFRVFATTALGAGLAVVSAAIFVPAGGRRYDEVETQFLATSIAKRWGGSSFVDLSIFKRWDPDTLKFVDLT